MRHCYFVPREQQHFTEHLCACPIPFCPLVAAYRRLIGAGAEQDACAWQTWALQCINMLDGKCKVRTALEWLKGLALWSADSGKQASRQGSVRVA